MDLWKLGSSQCRSCGNIAYYNNSSKRLFNDGDIDLFYSEQEIQIMLLPEKRVHTELTS